ncbi:TerD family protein [Luteipulveratus mongoliensis]|uniref:Chemical-damaging agent resistance protein C n=1 Tax=Luteipulveratus mongoliensis TaxID=571913 RepID=A0A0K1JDT7_9MICO|nr:TerD family protein [Luteipulveratus mongoliensis]AKU14869.1 chemical-damaging agent resistance protein C [Luteipulveratus mongoliensis]
MTVNLARGEHVSVPRKNVVVGLGWEIRPSAYTEFDVDASAILLGRDGKVLSDWHFVFFNNLTSPDGSVVHTGDDAGGSVDDEQITVDLARLHEDVDRIVFPASIYDADRREQSFGQLDATFIRVVDAADQREIARFTLPDDATTETAMVFGELYRDGADWAFRGVGKGYPSGLAGLARDFGVSV